ncbi:MAG TPA: A24 family peptidase [Brevundimonas sp.]|jgi:leader peptidase (prepilin peptidase)/N-methyltransferase
MPLPVLLAILLGLSGLAVGQALAVVSDRLPGSEDAVAATKSWSSLATSRRHLLFSFAAAGIGVWSALAANWPVAVAGAVLGWQLLVIADVDAEHFWLPDVLTLPLIGSGLMANGLLTHGLPWSQAIGAVGGFGLLWGLSWLYRTVRKRDGLGGGDPILFAGAGAWVGWTGLPAVFLTACAVLLFGVLLRLLWRKPVRGADRAPFGTLLAIGVWLVWLYGGV